MLKMATVNGAVTLGRSDLGSLEPEKGADLFMIDAGKLELTGKSVNAAAISAVPRFSEYASSQLYFSHKELSQQQ